MERARINGIDIAYELRGSGAPLVMIHGAQGDQTVFAGMAAAFAPRYRVLTFDQRGSGLSDKPDIPYTIAMIADDTASVMDGALAMRAASVSESPRDASTQYANTRSKSTEFAPAVIRTRSGSARSYAVSRWIPSVNDAPEHAKLVAVAPRARATIRP